MESACSRPSIVLNGRNKGSENITAASGPQNALNLSSFLAGVFLDGLRA